MFAAFKSASSPELKDFSALGEAPEYHPAYQSGVSILESFLSQRPRPERGVYALFAQDPEGRLRYVCSSGRSFDKIRFPEEIEHWPVGAPSGSGSIQRFPGEKPLSTWIPGLPDGGAALWHSLGPPQASDGLLMLWWPDSVSDVDESEVLAQFAGTLGPADAIFRIWQNNRRHERRYHRLKALEELSLAVASSLDLQDVLTKTHDAVVNALGFERTAIYVLDEDGHTLRGACATAVDGCAAAICDRAFDIRGSQHPVARVARGECDFYVVDRAAASGSSAEGDSPAGVSRQEVSRQQASAAPAAASGASSCPKTACASAAIQDSAAVQDSGLGAGSLANSERLGDPEAIVPLRAAGGVVGVIAIGSALRPVTMREEHLRVLLPFAAHAGAAVHNARMHEKMASQLRRTEELELQRSNFEREVILSVTEGKLSLCEAEEIPLLLGEPLASAALATAGDVARCRQVAVQAALSAGLSPDRKSDFELCLGEAATNCYQHAGGGDVEVYLKDDRIQFRIRDSGPGIQSFVLPRAMLLKGYSTTTSLGMGFSLMLTLSDRLYLATSTVKGTDMLIEMALQQTTEIERIWEQFGFLSDQAA